MKDNLFGSCLNAFRGGGDLRMKNTFRWGMIASLAILISGCATSMTSDRIVTNTYTSDISGKIIRSRTITHEYLNKSESLFDFNDSKGPPLMLRRTWGDNAKKYRWVNAFVKTGSAHYSGVTMPSFPMIADGIPLINEGDIVDILYLKNEYDFDFDKLIAHKIIKLVCKFNDKTCIENLKKTNKWNAVTGYEVKYSEEFINSLTYSKAR